MGPPFLVGYGQLFLSFNQIAGFFHKQYLYKNSCEIFDSLHGDNYQGKITSEITFAWVWLAVFLIQSDCRIH